jgi:hypothetical protein
MITKDQNIGTQVQGFLGEESNFVKHMFALYSIYHFLISSALFMYKLELL